MYSLLSPHRQWISHGLGLDACTAPGAPPAEPPPPPKARSPLYQWLRAKVPWLREAGVVAMIMVLASETIFIQDQVPRFLKHEEPLWIKMAVAYPRLIQAWNMFASLYVPSTTGSTTSSPSKPKL